MTSHVSARVDDYSNLRTVPAVIGLLFGLASLVQFGGIAPLEFSWFDYTLTGDHAMWISLGSLVVAFASSETTDFDDYATWEQAVMALGVGLIAADRHLGFVADFIDSLGDMGHMIAFALAFAAWGVATAGGMGGRR